MRRRKRKGSEEEMERVQSVFETPWERRRDGESVEWVWKLHFAANEKNPLRSFACVTHSEVSHVVVVVFQVTFCALKTSENFATCFFVSVNYLRWPRLVGWLVGWLVG